MSELFFGTIQTLAVGDMTVNDAFARAYPPPVRPTQPMGFVREQRGTQQGMGKQSSPLVKPF